MPTNEQRRATAKRKLERQLERRAAQARRRRLYTIIGSVAGCGRRGRRVVATVVVTNKDSDEHRVGGHRHTVERVGVADRTGTGGQRPAARVQAARRPGRQLPVPGRRRRPASRTTPPRTGKVPTDPAQVSASMSTNQGNIGLQLDNAKSPCTVNSFASLAQQGYFNDTPCHRLTTTAGLAVLQCGDPTGQGSGGPGYEFANEYPTNQYQPDDPALQNPVVYPRGTLAMANAGPGTNGSQFFLVYKDSQLPPNYTVFGTIDETGLATLDKIAAAGVDGGGQDGKPATPVQVKSIGLD